MAEVNLSSQYVADRLYQAGVVIMATPAARYTRTMREHIHQCMGGLTMQGFPDRRVADSELVDAEQALCWLHLLPVDQPNLRRILVARMQIGPQGDYLLSWSAIGAILEADRNTVKRWHGKAVDLIASALRRRGP